MGRIGKILILAVAAAALGGAAQAAPFALSSSSFKDGETLALKYAGSLAGNPNCPGQNVSPALAWSDPPEGTRSFALMVFDPDGAKGLGVAHFVAYGIAPAVTGFAEGELSAPSPKFTGGLSTQKLATYIGPCPPPGTPHHYSIVVVATDLEPAALPAGLTRDALLAALAGHARAASGIVGVFGHP